MQLFLVYLFIYLFISTEAVHVSARVPTRSAFEQRCVNVTEVIEVTETQNYFNTSECFQEQLQEDYR